jgi:hypothetical protein
VELVIRPATPEDVARRGSTTNELLPDRWREGGNRRSFVAVRDGAVVGHARGIDNAVHPASRVTVLDVDPVPDRTAIAIALIRTLRDTSDRPLHLKLGPGSTLEREVAHVFGAVTIQAMPPWRYVVGPELRSWAATHRGPVELTTTTDPGAMLDLLVRHYLDQHAAWSPADETALRRELAAEVEPGGHDADRSVILRRDGRLVAAGLLWPEDVEPWGGPEVSLVCADHGTAQGRVDMEVCLAGVIDRSPDGAVLLVDSHVTEEVESAMMRDVPGPPPHPSDGWGAIVAIAVDGGPPPLPMPEHLIPAELSRRSSPSPGA